MKQVLGVLFLFATLFVYSGCNEITLASDNSNDCGACSYAESGCNVEESTIVGQDVNFTFMLGLIAFAMFILWLTTHKRLYLIVFGLGVVLFGGILIRTYAEKRNPQLVSAISGVENQKSELLNVNGNDDFLPAGSEFENLNDADSVDEFSAGLDEFSGEGSDEFTNNLSDEFSNEKSEEYIDSSKEENPNNDLSKLISILFILVALIGFTIRFKFVRRLRWFVLIGTIVYLGFVKGGCPCVIMGFHNTILYAMGNSLPLTLIIWFIGLIPITYFVGRVWCGWLCHLGGLQEFLFKANHKKLLSSKKSQQILKYVHASVFVILIIQIVVTQTNIWKLYDPFKVIFNLYSTNITGYILVGILLISSIFIYKPFCNTACPVGFVLGWVSKIPKARRLTISSSCKSCNKCVKTCNNNALYNDGLRVLLRNENCVLCGECLDECKFNALNLDTK